MNNKGQAILSEYVMVIFVVVAAAMAITTYLQRGLEARIHEARNFMVKSVVDSGACDDNCVEAAGSSISVEYEPYYVQMLSDVGANKQDNAGATNGNPVVIGAKYLRAVNENTQTIATSTQLPPCSAASPIPSWCN